MKTRLKKTVAAVLVASLLTTGPLHASQLSDAMDGMFTAMTQPQGFSTPTMNGVAFGSASVRFPVQNFNSISFDPPRINAGCSGIDMYMGSFSFINSEQLKTMLRAFAQGAVGYAFKTAIRAICGSCMATLDDLQAITQRMNTLGKNTCALSKLAADTLTNKFGAQEKADKAESLLMSARQTVDDWFKGEEKTKLNGLGDRGNIYNGNLTIRALFNSGAADRFGSTGSSRVYGMSGDMPDLIMNLVGTQIVPTGNNDKRTCTGGDSGDCRRAPETIIGKLNFDHILNGRSGTGERITFWRCDTRDEEMACQNPTETDFQFEGTRRYVQRMLFGDNASAYAPSSDSIMGTILRSGVGGLTTQQKNFLSSAQSIPLMGVIYRTQHSRDIAQAILSQSADYVAHEMAYKIVFEAIQITEQAFSKNTVTMPSDMQTKIAALRADIATKGYQNAGEVLATLDRIETLLTAVNKKFPRADMSWLRR